MNRILRSLGIDPKRYRLLTGLFNQLSESHEMLNQLGRGGVTLQTIAWMYFAMMGFFSMVYVLAAPPLTSYFWTLLSISAFFLFLVLLSETENSLVNPLEGLILAHQPIDGATYTAAKLAHLARILLFLVPALNAGPALAGLLLKGAWWWYPAAHMAAAFAIGLMAALLCCAIFGWLIRFVPAPRLKAAAQFAQMVPFLAFFGLQFARDRLKRIHILDMLPDQAAVRTGLAVALAALCVAIVVFGIRSLSGDYLIRVSSIVHGGSSARVKPGRSPIGSTWLPGGPGSRAGFEYVWRMMLRDWQFRRSLTGFVPTMIVSIVVVVGGLRVSPFAAKFSPMHGLPHVFGLVLFLICFALPYGNDHKGVWIFLLAPSRILGQFARGVHALLWIRIVVIPHVVLALPVAWSWGIRDAGLFVPFSLAVASLYLALELRLIQGVPFGKQAEASGSAMMMPVIFLGGAAMAVAIIMQYVFVFRSPAIVIATTMVAGAAAYMLTRSSLRALEVNIRYSLGLLSMESSAVYKEVDA